MKAPLVEAKNSHRGTETQRKKNVFIYFPLCAPVSLCEKTSKGIKT